jgi:hypothetical protein
MKKLAADMGFNNLHEEMKMSLMEVASIPTPISTTFVTFKIAISKVYSRRHTWT